MSNPIDTVLQAEQRAEQEIEHRRAAARQRVNQAMERARRISERANGRITSIHTGCEAKTKAACDALWAAYQDQPKTEIDIQVTADRLSGIAKRVASQLTGGDDD